MANCVYCNLLTLFLCSTGDLSSRGHLYQISTSDFERNILPRLTEHDTVIWVGSDQSTASSEEDEIYSLIDKCVPRVDCMGRL